MRSAIKMTDSFVVLADGVERTHEVNIEWSTGLPRSIEWGPERSEERAAATALARETRRLVVVTVYRDIPGRFLSYYDENLEYVEFPKGTVSLGDIAVRVHKATRIVLPSTLQRIGAENCYGNNIITYVEIPDNVRTIGDRSFSELLKIMKIRMPRRLEHCDDNVFSKLYNLRTIDVSPVLKTVGRQFLWQAISLREFVAPSTLEKIDDGFLAACRSLVTCDMSAAKVTSFASNFLAGCVSLTRLVVREDQRPADPWAYVSCLCGNERRTQLWPILSEITYVDRPDLSYDALYGRVIGHHIPHDLGDACNDALRALRMNNATPQQFLVLVGFIYCMPFTGMRAHESEFVLSLRVNPVAFPNFELHRHAMYAAHRKVTARVQPPEYPLSNYEHDVLRRYRDLLEVAYR